MVPYYPSPKEMWVELFQQFALTLLQTPATQ